MSREQLEQLQKETHYDANELRTIYKQFKSDAPEGTINKEEFTKTMKQMGVKDSFLHELVFGAFDDNKDGSINFKEFICALSIMTRGSPDEKLEFAFMMYDLDGNGFITREEMHQIMDSFYKLVGGLVTFSGDKYETPDTFVKKFFDEMDTNGDGQISLEEYKAGAMRNPDIVKGLKLFA
eukprot:TRINITY_DN674_c2_g1_i1.p1 TRINITY_DN674_c2_g1~~TRINITY_DN674_c2_g1_i1.p1  ORF type:complete len:190 (-),score=65.70 TRINITY_DN674_c2_g1_i1:156-695(-)